MELLIETITDLLGLGRKRGHHDIADCFSGRAWHAAQPNGPTFHSPKKSVMSPFCSPDFEPEGIPAT
jgi:hypothetical protein